MSRRAKSTIPKSQIVLLKKEITAKHGKGIINTADCYELSDAIYRDTGKLISYNTLRRFYGIVKGNDIEINSTSLDILTNYCGYSSFNFFVNKKPKLDVSGLNETFLDLVDEVSFSHSVIESMCEKYGHYTQVYHFLEKCLVLAFNHHKVSFFKSFYTLPKVFELTPYTLMSIFDLAMLFARLLDKMDDEVKREILKDIAKYENARVFFFEYYVDLDNLNHGYRYALDIYIKHSTKVDAFVFYHCLGVFQGYLNADEDLVTQSCTKLRSLEYEEQELHPFLQGRILAAIIYKDKIFGKVIASKVLDRMKQTLPSFKDVHYLNAQLYLTPVLQAIQLTGEYELLVKSVELASAMSLTKADYLSDNASNYLKIYWGHTHILKNEVVEANAMINQIKPQKFPKFEKKLQKISFNLMLKNYYVHQDKVVESIECQRQVEALAKEMEFKIFQA